MNGTYSSLLRRRTPACVLPSSPNTAESRDQRCIPAHICQANQVDPTPIHICQVFPEIVNKGLICCAILQIQPASSNDFKCQNVKASWFTVAGATNDNHVAVGAKVSLLNTWLVMTPQKTRFLFYYILLFNSYIVIAVLDILALTLVYSILRLCCVKICLLKI